jgi:parvulin-like peptidyl-prolyl isomerase
VTRRISLLSLALLAVLASACGRYLTTGVAVVNGETISKDQLDSQIASSGQAPEGTSAEELLQQERQAIVSLIVDELVRQEATRLKVTVTEAQVTERFQAIGAAQPEDLQREIESRGEAGVRKLIEGQMLAEGVSERATGNVVATEEEIRAAYGNGRRFEEIRLRHILFQVAPGADEAPAHQKAEDTLTRLRAGADFATLARQLSEDPGSKDNGGDYGYITRETPFDETFLNAAFAVREGRISGLVRTQFGFHIIKIEDRRTKTLEQARAELSEEIASGKRTQAFQEFLVEKLRAANIVVNPRWGDFDPETFRIEDHEFFVPASPAPETQPIPFQ